MAWKIKFHKSTLKFLKSLEGKRQDQIKKRLNELLTYLDKGVFPYNRLDIKRMRGKWEGSFRMRVGDVRIIFALDKENKVVWVWYLCVTIGYLFRNTHLMMLSSIMGRWMLCAKHKVVNAYSGNKREASLTICLL